MLEQPVWVRRTPSRAVVARRWWCQQLLVLVLPQARWSRS
jgi:hypothetical protein